MVIFRVRSHLVNIYINKGTISQSVTSVPSVIFPYELATNERVVTNTLGVIINIKKLPAVPRISGASAT